MGIALKVGDCLQLQEVKPYGSKSSPFIDKSAKYKVIAVSGEEVTVVRRGAQITFALRHDNCMQRADMWQTVVSYRVLEK